MKRKTKRSADVTNIRRLRLKAGITQENLARQVGVTTHTIWRLENDPAANPRLQTLRAVANALGTTISELLDMT
jgi:transcriptional regulator with XRE-family HTH domain